MSAVFRLSALLVLLPSPCCFSTASTPINAELPESHADPTGAQAQQEALHATHSGPYWANPQPACLLSLSTGRCYLYSRKASLEAMNVIYMKKNRWIKSSQAVDFSACSVHSNVHFPVTCHLHVHEQVFKCPCFAGPVLQCLNTSVPSETDRYISLFVFFTLSFLCSSGGLDTWLSLWEALQGRFASKQPSPSTAKCWCSISTSQKRTCYLPRLIPWMSSNTHHTPSPTKKKKQTLERKAFWMVN